MYKTQSRRGTKTGFGTRTKSGTVYNTKKEKCEQRVPKWDLDIAKSNYSAHDLVNTPLLLPPTCNTNTNRPTILLDSRGVYTRTATRQTVLPVSRGVYTRNANRPTMLLVSRGVSTGKGNVPKRTTLFICLMVLRNLPTLAIRPMGSTYSAWNHTNHHRARRGASKPRM